MSKLDGLVFCEAQNSYRIENKKSHSVKSCKNLYNSTSGICYTFVNICYTLFTICEQLFIAGVFTFSVMNLSYSVGAQSLQIKDLQLGATVQIGSFDYVKVADNKYMQSTEVACPDGATVGGKYVKCFASKTKYEEQCSGGESCGCTEKVVVIGSTNMTLYGCNSGCANNATYNKVSAKCVCNDSNYEYLAVAKTDTGEPLYACVKKSTINNFGYTGGIQNFTVPQDGIYKLEVWGASGGNGSNDYILQSYGGMGGYSYGTTTLTKGQILYVVVGGQGAHSTSNTSVAGGYNGGGSSGTGSNASYTRAGAGGGGATHIATRTGLLNALSSYQSQVLIVAGGGGGGGGRGDGGYTSSGYGYGMHNGGNGGNGGGDTGTNGTMGSGVNARGRGGYYGSQSSGGIGGESAGLSSGTLATAYPGGGGGAGGGWYGGGGGSGGARRGAYSNAGGSGSFGKGGNGSNSTTSGTSNSDVGAGGGGGGGSGYIGGVIDGATYIGAVSFPSTSNGTEYGHSGNGYARITLLSVD